MRFLLVIHYADPHIGGMEALVDKQARSLIERGHSVTVATCRPGLDVPLREVRADGVEIVRFRSLNAIENVFGVTFPVISPVALLWFVRALRRYDVVHVHDVLYISSWLAALACSLRGRPYFLTQHVEVVGHTSRVVVAVQRAVYRLVGARIMRRAQKVVVYNDNVARFVRAQGVAAEDVVVKRNGIDTDYFAPVDAPEKRALRERYGYSPDARIVLFVGRLVPKKGFEIVLDGADPRNTYVVAGSGRVPDRYDRAHFFGPATEEQVRDLYRLADVFAFPSLGEVFTLVHQEAMACGLPVVVADDVGYADAGVDRSLMLLCERTPAAVAAAVERVLGDEALRAEMARYSRRLAVEEFSWQANVDQEYALYEAH